MPRLHFHDTRPDRVARRLERIAADEAFRRTVYWRTIAFCLLCTAFGLTLIAAGLTSTSPVWGPLAFWAGVIGADVGICATLTWAYLRLEH